MAVPFVPLFDGLAVFGEAVIMDPVPMPARMAITQYPGVHGSQIQRLGACGTVFNVSGAIVGVNFVDIDLNIDTLRNYMHVQFVASMRDTINRVWPQCMFTSFSPQDRYTPYSGVYGSTILRDGIMKRYSATLITPHVTIF